ncbi:agrin-like protein [Dermatophagoides farinae]|uniref:Agrin-like protein n=1 Tax=Dermatophagoides farinae TaxID=6954 RepID=A0A9D4P5R0_DERFA|nr:agrin-like protein [Dermatophagoides farinae]
MNFNQQILLKILCLLLALIIINVDGQSSSSSSSYRLRRRCPTIFPTHKQLMNSNSIILIGLVEQIRPLDNIDYMDNSINRQPNYQLSQQQQQQQHRYNQHRIMWPMYWFVNQRIQITGFNPNTDSKFYGGNQWCYPNTRQGDSWIFVLQPINYPDYFRLNSSLIKVTLSNIERLDSIIADQPYGLRIDFPELPCERKYCPNNANCINDPYGTDGARCECLTQCNHNIKYQPICASDDETYNNECEMRLRSCRSNKNLFIKAMNSCYYFYQKRPTNTITSSLSSSSSNRSIFPPNGQSNRYRTATMTTTTTTSSSSSSSSSNTNINNNQPMEMYRFNRPEYPLPDLIHNDKNRQSSSTTNRQHITINRSYSY